MADFGRKSLETLRPRSGAAEAGAVDLSREHSLTAEKQGFSPYVD